MTNLPVSPIKVTLPPISRFLTNNETILTDWCLTKTNPTTCIIFYWSLVSVMVGPGVVVMASDFSQYACVSAILVFAVLTEHRHSYTQIYMCVVHSFCCLSNGKHYTIVVVTTPIASSVKQRVDKSVFEWWICDMNKYHLYAVAWHAICSWRRSCQNCHKAYYPSSNERVVAQSNMFIYTQGILIYQSRNVYCIMNDLYMYIRIYV